jgi:membrane glycosyltransferase
VKRNRHRTQQIARDVFGESRWAGLSWWSMQRPECVLHAIWHHDRLVVEDIQDLRGHPGLREAGTLLANAIDPDLA